MSLSQAESSRLLEMPKEFEPSVVVVEFPRVQAFTAEYILNGRGTREQFILDLDRGNKKRARLKFQTRARKIYVLARIDIEGRPHRNPPDAPHRPGERFTSTHLHLYHDGYGDRVAYLPGDLPTFVVPADGTDDSWLVSFLKFCNVRDVPPIQTEI
jgi:hypothetical protein